MALKAYLPIGHLLSSLAITETKYIPTLSPVICVLQRMQAYRHPGLVHIFENCLFPFIAQKTWLDTQMTR